MNVILSAVQQCSNSISEDELVVIMIPSNSHKRRRNYAVFTAQLTETFLWGRGAELHQVLQVRLL